MFVDVCLSSAISDCMCDVVTSVVNSRCNMAFSFFSMQFGCVDEWQLLSDNILVLATWVP